MAATRSQPESATAWQIGKSCVVVEDPQSYTVLFCPIGAERDQKRGSSVDPWVRLANTGVNSFGTRGTFSSQKEEEKEEECAVPTWVV